MKPNLLNYKTIGKPAFIDEIYINSFNEFVKTNNTEFLHIGTNGNPNISCYNSTKTLSGKMLCDPDIFQPFKKCVLILCNNDVKNINPEQMVNLLNCFDFWLYHNADIKDIYKKIIMYNLINVDEIIEDDDYIEFISKTIDNEQLLFDNPSIKKYYKKRMSLIEDICYLTEEEKNLLSIDLSGNKPKEMQYSCSYYGEEKTDISNFVDVINKLIKNKEVELVKRNRKRLEKKNVVNYYACNDGSVLLVLNKVILGSNNYDRRAYHILDSSIINYSFDMSDALDFNNFVIIEDPIHIPSPEIFEAMNEFRKLQGLEELTEEDLRKPTYSITLDFYND